MVPNSHDEDQFWPLLGSFKSTNRIQTNYLNTQFLLCPTSSLLLLLKDGQRGSGSHGLSVRKATRTKSRGPKSLQLEVGARRAPRILVDICGSSVMALVALPWHCGGPCTALVGPLSTLKMCIALTFCGGGPSSFLWWPYSCPTMLVQGDFFTGTP